MVLVHVCGPPSFGCVMLNLQVQVQMSTAHPLFVLLRSENDKSEGESVHSEMVHFLCVQRVQKGLGRKLGIQFIGR